MPDDKTDDQVATDYFDAQMKALTDAVAGMGAALSSLPAAIAEALKGSASHGDGSAAREPGAAPSGGTSGAADPQAPHTAAEPEPDPEPEREPLPFHPWWRKLGS